MIKPIQTEYKGTQFRSRIEAKWAAFFDGIEWPWRYEAIDLEWYIPDFYLPGHNIYVEVKSHMTVEELKQDSDKVREASRKDGREFAIVGGHYTVQIGLPPVPDDSDSKWKEAGNLTQYHSKVKTVPVTLGTATPMMVEDLDLYKPSRPTGPLILGTAIPGMIEDLDLPSPRTVTLATSKPVIRLD